jgi:hypothetical protein
MYLMRLWDDSAADNIGPSRVLTASSAIHFYITLHGRPSPTDHPLCVAVRELARRKLHGKKVQKEPVDSTDISKLVAHFARPGASLSALMHVTAMCLMYGGLMRFDDMAEFCVHRDLCVIHPTHVEVFIPRSKTDRYWEGHWIPIARTNSPSCPVRLLERLLLEGSYMTVPDPLIPDQDVGPLPRPVRTIGNRQVLQRLVGTFTKPVYSLSYDTFRKHVKQMCAEAGIPKNITPHCMRVGGATEAAAAGCPDRLIMKQGRWLSESVKNGYIRESLDALLLVSRSVWG